MKTKSLLWLVLCLPMGLNSFGQKTSGQIKEIKLGEKVPNQIFRTVINYPENNINLVDFKGKILILDFWNFNCVSCIASWPKLMKLQQEFNDKIQIVLVNTDNSSTEVRDFIVKREKNTGNKMSLPVICGDKSLDELFPHYSFPHVIWVDKEGIVKHRTKGIYLDSDNLSSMIANKEMKLYDVNADLAIFDRSKPLFINENGGGLPNGNKIQFSSIITDYNPLLRGGVEFGTTNESSFGIFVNAHYKFMLTYLHSTEVDEHGNTLNLPKSLLDVSRIDSSRFVPVVNGKFTDSNFHTFQMIAPKIINKKVLKNKMISDLEKYLGVESKWEKRIKKCLIVSRSNYPISTFKAGQRALGISTVKLKLNDVTIKEFLRFLGFRVPHYSSSRFNYPIIDESNFYGKLGGIDIETNMANYIELSKALEKYGLRLTVEDREVNVLCYQYVADRSI